MNGGLKPPIFFFFSFLLLKKNADENGKEKNEKGESMCGRDVGKCPTPVAIRIDHNSGTLKFNTDESPASTHKITKMNPFSEYWINLYC